MTRYAYTTDKLIDVSYLTTNKRYEIIEEYNMGSRKGFIIIDDDGGRLSCFYERCGHIENGDWIIEENEVIPVNTDSTEAYKQIIDYLPSAKPEELLGIALEAAKANPVFFINALSAVREKGLSKLSELVNGIGTINTPQNRKIVVKMSGTYLDIDEKEFIDVFVKLSNDGKKVEAIKKIRELTGLGLKEAKDVVDDTDSYIPSGANRACVATNIGQLVARYGGTIT